MGVDEITGEGNGERTEMREQRLGMKSARTAEGTIETRGTNW